MAQGVKRHAKGLKKLRNVASNEVSPKKEEGEGNSKRDSVERPDDQKSWECEIVKSSKAEDDSRGTEKA